MKRIGAPLRTRLERSTPRVCRFAVCVAVAAVVTGASTATAQPKTGGRWPSRPGASAVKRPVAAFSAPTTPRGVVEKLARAQRGGACEAWDRRRGRNQPPRPGFDPKIARKVCDVLLPGVCSIVDIVVGLKDLIAFLGRRDVRWDIGRAVQIGVRELRGLFNDFGRCAEARVTGAFAPVEELLTLADLSQFGARLRGVFEGARGGLQFMIGELNAVLGIPEPLNTLLIHVVGASLAGAQTAALAPMGVLFFGVRKAMELVIPELIVGAGDVYNSASARLRAAGIPKEVGPIIEGLLQVLRTVGPAAIAVFTKPETRERIAATLEKAAGVLEKIEKITDAARKLAEAARAGTFTSLQAALEATASAPTALTQEDVGRMVSALAQIAKDEIWGALRKPLTDLIGKGLAALNRLLDAPRNAMVGAVGSIPFIGGVLASTLNFGLGFVVGLMNDFLTSKMLGLAQTIVTRSIDGLGAAMRARLTRDASSVSATQGFLGLLRHVGEIAKRAREEVAAVRAGLDNAVGGLVEVAVRETLLRGVANPKLRAIVAGAIGAIVGELAKGRPSLPAIVSRVLARAAEPVAQLIGETIEGSAVREVVVRGVRALLGGVERAGGLQVMLQHPGGFFGALAGLVVDAIREPLAGLLLAGRNKPELQSGVTEALGELAALLRREGMAGLLRLQDLLRIAFRKLRVPLARELLAGVRDESLRSLLERAIASLPESALDVPPPRPRTRDEGDRDDGSGAGKPRPRDAQKPGGGDAIEIRASPIVMTGNGRVDASGGGAIEIRTSPIVMTGNGGVDASGGGAIEIRTSPIVMTGNGGVDPSGGTIEIRTSPIVMTGDGVGSSRKTEQDAETSQKTPEAEMVDLRHHCPTPPTAQQQRHHGPLGAWRVCAMTHFRNECRRIARANRPAVLKPGDQARFVGAQAQAGICVGVSPSASPESAWRDLKRLHDSALDLWHGIPESVRAGRGYESGGKAPSDAEREATAAAEASWNAFRNQWGNRAVEMERQALTLVRLSCAKGEDRPFVDWVTANTPRGLPTWMLHRCSFAQQREQFTGAALRRSLQACVAELEPKLARFELNARGAWGRRDTRRCAVAQALESVSAAALRAGEGALAWAESASRVLSDCRAGRCDALLTTLLELVAPQGSKHEFKFEIKGELEKIFQVGGEVVVSLTRNGVGPRFAVEAALNRRASITAAGIGAKEKISFQTTTWRELGAVGLAVYGRLMLAQFDALCSVVAACLPVRPLLERATSSGTDAALRMLASHGLLRAVEQSGCVNIGRADSSTSAEGCIGFATVPAVDGRSASIRLFKELGGAYKWEPALAQLARLPAFAHLKEVQLSASLRLTLTAPCERAQVTASPADAVGQLLGQCPEAARGVELKVEGGATAAITQSNAQGILPGAPGFTVAFKGVITKAVKVDSTGLRAFLLAHAAAPDLLLAEQGTWALTAQASRQFATSTARETLEVIDVGASVTRSGREHPVCEGTFRAKPTATFVTTRCTEIDAFQDWLRGLKIAPTKGVR